MYPSLTVLMGPQASGKSTWAKQQSPDHPVLSSDSWFQVDATGARYYWDEEGEVRYYNDGLTSQILSCAWAWVWFTFAIYLRDRKSFVFEGTFPSRISRSHIIHMAQAFGYTVTCVYFDLPLAECLRRNRERINVVPDKVIARTYASMEPPSEEEGWDEILVIRE